MENDRADVTHFSVLINILKSQQHKFRILGLMVGIWSNIGQGRKLVDKIQNVESFQNGLAYSGKS